MQSRKFGLLVLALATINLSGCAALGQLGDNVWSGTQAFGAKTHKQLTHFLRPAPKADYVFDAGDATLNTAKLEKQVFEPVTATETVEDARIRFVAEIPDLRPTPSFTPDLFERSYALPDVSAAVEHAQPAAFDGTQTSLALSPIDVEILDVDAVRLDSAAPTKPKPKPRKAPAFKEFGYGDLELAGGPGSPELKL